MKYAVAVMMLFVGMLAVAQTQSNSGGNNVQQQSTTTAIQEKEKFDKQVADAKAAAEAEQKKKDDAEKNLDNKNPQPIAGECSLWDDKHKHCELSTEALISAMFSEAMQSQMALRAAQQQAAAFLANPQAEASAKTKVLLDLVKELQKSNHAQGCDITPPKIVDKKQVGLQWDCTNAAANVAAESKQK